MTATENASLDELLGSELRKRLLNELAMETNSTSPTLRRETPSVQSAFDTIKRKLMQLLTYATAIVPTVKGNPEWLAELADSIVVLVATRFDAFLQGVVSLATRHRAAAVRKYFVDRKRKDAAACALPDLVSMVRARVSFKNDAKHLEELFELLFDRSPWPSDDVRDVLLDLILLRNMIVHRNGEDWSEEGKHPPAYATQFRRADVLTVHTYGTFSTYRVDPLRALLFVQLANNAIVEQLKYLEQHLVRDTSWADPADE